MHTFAVCYGSYVDRSVGILHLLSGRTRCSVRVLDLNSRSEATEPLNDRRDSLSSSLVSRRVGDESADFPFKRRNEIKMQLHIGDINCRGNARLLTSFDFYYFLLIYPSIVLASFVVFLLPSNDLSDRLMLSFTCMLILTCAEYLKEQNVLTHF